MKISKVVLAFLMAVGIAQAEAPKVTAVLYASGGNAEKQIADVMKNKIAEAGFHVMKANTHIEKFYYEKYKEKGVEMISFYDVLNMKAIRPLLLKNPDFGAFTPFNFLVYKTLDNKNDDFTWYGHLDADMMLDIIGEKDAASRDAFRKMVAGLDDVIKKELKPVKEKVFPRSKPLPQVTLTKMVKKFEAPDDMEEFVEDFVMEHDGRFSKHNFIIAGFIDMKFEYSDMDLAFDKYDAYWVSLLCHFEFSNSIFNRGKPYAGIFAPCSIYFYIPKGKNELHVGYSSVTNWISGLDFTDPKRIEYMKSIDNEVVETFKELGFELIQK
ncbi:MAG: hypothetical protein L3J47_09615 [Sulfurovum sp.]|nr:hypothetical protein [Sulfurovum sp.]